MSINSTEKYPAKDHARRVAQYISAHSPDLPSNVDWYIYLENQQSIQYEDSDQDQVLRINRNFYYLSGCIDNDCALLYHPSTDKLTLSLPPADKDTILWSGSPLTEQHARNSLQIDSALSRDAFFDVLAGSNVGCIIYVLPNRHNLLLNTLPQLILHLNTIILPEALKYCRLRKDDYELACIRLANELSAPAHIALMKSVSSDVFLPSKEIPSEVTLHRKYQMACFNNTKNFIPSQAYDSIIAAGSHAAVLHYVHKDDTTPLKPPTLVLVDAGQEFRCYASDISRTFPCGGKFSSLAREIYSLVLRMQDAAFSLIRPNVLWQHVHIAAHRVAIAGLLNLGLFQVTDDSIPQLEKIASNYPPLPPNEPTLPADLYNQSPLVDAILKARLSVAFFPHGLGHHLGLDTHDCEVMPGLVSDRDTQNGSNSTPDPLFRYLRIFGTVPLNAVVTVEPGLYFSSSLFSFFFESKPDQQNLINKTVLANLYTVGGVRIEDNVVVTRDGYQNLTTVPKTIEDIEKLINQP